MRWLHISNLGFGLTSANVQEMRENLLNLAENIPPVDRLFLTGNLRYAKRFSSGGIRRKRRNISGRYKNAFMSRESVLFWFPEIMT